MFWNKKKYDLIAIGDTVTDAFIRLKEAHINTNPSTDTSEICMKFADKIPYEFVEVCPAVGNSANAAVSVARLGLNVAMMTDVGDDQNGNEAITRFKEEKIATELVHRHSNFKTNYHYVLWFEAERTILIKHEKYPYILPKFSEPKWIYFSSLGEHSLPFHKEIEQYLEAHPNVKLAFSPNTFQIKWTNDILGIYKNTEIFSCNVEEAGRILKIESIDIPTLAKGIHALGPKTVLITDGPKGAYASNGTDIWFMPIYPDIKAPYERTGAGDAFFSTFIGAVIHGKSIEEALTWAPINSMAVAQEIGAQKGLLSKEKLLEYLKNAPADYKPRKI